MFYRKLAGIVLGVGLTTLLVWGERGPKTPWEKPVEAWTAEDVEALLNSSPWAVATGAYMDDPYEAREEQPVGPPITGQPGERRQPWDGGPGMNRKGHLATVPVTLRWESALPIRLAEKEAAAKEGDEWYEISVAGLVPGGVYHEVTAAAKKDASGGDGFDAHDAEEVKEAFMSYSKIVPSRGADLVPENVKFDTVSGLVRIYFPRKTVIDPEQKEVVFETHFGKLHVKAKFRISSMKFHGKIEL